MKYFHEGSRLEVQLIPYPKSSLTWIHKIRLIMMSQSNLDHVYFIMKLFPNKQHRLNVCNNKSKQHNNVCRLHKKSITNGN